MIDSLAAWHHFIVHFAVSFTILAALLDAADFLTRNTRFTQTSFLLTIIAIPCLIAAVLTGNLAATFVTDPEQLTALGQHQTYANIAVWVFTAAGLWRVFLHFKKQFHGRKVIIYVFIVMLAAASVFLAARKGGSIRHSRPTITLRSDVAANA